MSFTPTKSADHQVVDLSADVVALKTTESIREAAIEAVRSGHTHYTDRPGVAELRDAVAIKLAEFNRVHMSPSDEILITAGRQEALYLAAQVMFEPDHEVVIVGPALPRDLELIRMVGAAPRVAAPTDDLAPNPESVEALITEHTSALLIREPSPAGQTADSKVIKRLADLAIKHELKVIAVEGNESYTAAGVSSFSIGGIAGMAPRTVTINDFGAFGLDAWRVAYLAAQRELMGPIRRLKQELSICSPAISQYAALSGMAHVGAHMAARRDQMDARRTAVHAALDAHGISYAPGESGIFTMLRPPAGESSWHVLERLEDHGIKLAAGETIGAPGWLRMTLDREPDDLKAAVAAIAEVGFGSNTAEVGE